MYLIGGILHALLLFISYFDHEINTDRVFGHHILIVHSIERSVKYDENMMITHSDSHFFR